MVKNIAKKNELINDLIKMFNFNVNRPSIYRLNFVCYII